MTVFLGGVLLLLLVFRLAYGMFTVTPHDALGLAPGQPIQLEDAGARLVSLVLRVLLLVVMGIVGSLIANRGISLYTASRPVPLAQEEEEIERERQVGARRKAVIVTESSETEIEQRREP
jgi:cytochrome b561